MEHDEKRKSQEDGNLSSHDDKRDDGTTEGDADNTAQSSSSESTSSDGLSEDFGMPKLNFSQAARGRKAAHTASSDSDADQQPSSDADSDDASMPLGEDTGWESGASIARMGSLNARLNSQETPFVLGPDYLDESNNYTEEPQQANVMPFPGSSMSRPPEAPAQPMYQGAPSDTGYGSEYSDYEEELLQETADEESEGEALAGAVQLALRSVYGNQAEEDDGQDDYMVAGTLISGNARGPEFDWAQPKAYQEEEDQYQAQEEEAASAEANTEAVLDYLYGHRRSEYDGVELTLDTALHDFDPEAAEEGEWVRREGGDDYRHGHETPFPGTPGHATRQHDAHSESRYYAESQRNISDAEWEQATYIPNLPMRAATPVYSTQPEQLSGGTDSGHLLGAAGLGLIGGIALAGVLAVFVANSFMNDDGTPKVSERLAMSQGGQLQRSDYNRNSQPAAQARMTPSGISAQPYLNVQSVSGESGEPIKLNIALANPESADEALVSIKGLPKEAKLSTGIDVGGGQWLLPPARVDDVNIVVPPGTTGAHNLSVQLLKDDAQTSLTEPVSFSLNIASKTADVSAKAPVLPDDSAKAETDFVTQMLIRDGNKAMRDGDIVTARRLYEQAAMNGNPEAALAMGRSFDPTYFERLNVKTGKPDPATAFEWYKKALNGGLVTARVKIDALKQWLQK